VSCARQGTAYRAFIRLRPVPPVAERPPPRSATPGG